jgi:hypothetical protein
MPDQAYEYDEFLASGGQGLRASIVTIEWWYNEKPESRDTETGIFVRFRANGDAEVIGRDGRHYVGTLVEEREDVSSSSRP